MNKHRHTRDNFWSWLAGLLVWRELINPRPSDEEIYRRVKQQREAEEAELKYQEMEFEQWKSETEYRPDADDAVKVDDQL